MSRKRITSLCWRAATLACCSVVAAGCRVPAITDPDIVALTDSTGKRTFDIGNYEQCVSSGHQHCINWYGGVPIGVCVPTDCDRVADVGNVSSPLFTKYILAQVPLAAILILEGAPVAATCGSHEEEPSRSANAVIGLTAIWGALVLAATAYTAWSGSAAKAAHPKSNDDAALPSRPSLLHELAGSVSLTRSVPALLRTTGERSGAWAPMNGVRVLSMCLVILGHTLFFAYTPGPGYDNPSFIQPPGGLALWTMQVFPSAEFAVDTFFTLAGFLSSYLLAKELSKYIGWAHASSKKQRMQGVDAKPLLSVNDGDEVATAQPAQGAGAKVVGALVYYVVHRVWRLLPLLGYVIAFYACVMPALSSGPFWMYMHGMADMCSKWWWTNLLFINVYVPVHDNFNNECMPWTWYLSLDMQLYLLTPIVVIVFLKNAKAGWALMASALIACLIASEEIVRQSGISVLIQTNPQMPANGDYNPKFYTKPWTRAPAYLIGIALAFFMFSQDLRSQREKEAEDGDAAGTRETSEVNTSTSQRPLHRWLREIALWSALVVMAVIYYVPTDYFQEPQGKWTRGVVVFFTAFSRPIWCAGLAVMLYVCMTERHHVFSKFLSLPIFEPLARVTYSAYLTHPLVMMVIYYSSRSMYHFDQFMMAAYYCGNVAITYVLAGVLFLLIEYPCGALERVVRNAVHASREHRKRALQRPDHEAARWKSSAAVVDAHNHVSAEVQIAVRPASGNA